MTSAIPARALLELAELEVLYDDVVLALRGVSLTVPEGSVVALLGPNGAGKTSTLRAAAGLLRAQRGSIARGTVSYDGQRAETRSARQHVLSGIAEVLEGRHCFPHLSVEENLISGTLARPTSKAEVGATLERIYRYFPRLRDKRRLPAGYCSGGEQQMIAIGRALASKPRLVLLDEPSMGLAPMVVHEIFEIVRTLNEQEGTSFLLAEQNAVLALRYADYGYVMENGRVALHAPARELATLPAVRELYLGLAPRSATLQA